MNFIVGGLREKSIGRHIYKNLTGDSILSDIDVRDEKQIQEQMSKYKGKLNSLIYTAGIYSYGKIKDQIDKTWNNILEVNLIGAKRCLKWFLRTQEQGTIILIGSNASDVPSAGSSAYCVSKAGMGMLTKVAGQEIAPEFNIVQLDLGIVKNTGMYHDTHENMGVNEEEMLKKRLKAVPADRCLTKDEIVDYVEFILNKGSYLNGVSLRIDGGKIKSSGKDD